MLVIYLMTVAPTLSFWDCGEFITCSYIMGIPHPPGSPLLSILGRVFSLIPFHDFRGLGNEEIAYRVNMIDVLLGALTVMLTYLVVVRIFRKLRQAGTRLEEAITMFAATVTAFMAGFSNEFWENAIETETYMPSLFMQLTALWLVLKWLDRKDDLRTVRYLFLAAYILGLGNGVHLTVLLMAPTLFLIVLFAKPDWFRHANLWGSLVLLLAVAGIVKLFTGLGIQYLVMAAFAIVSPPILYKMYKKEAQAWKVTLLGMIFCGSLYIIGFSVYPTVMVRAGKSPAINEGNPDNWNRYTLYIERDQYGQDNMYVAAFNRKSSFGYQFKYMYLRYLLQQFPKWGPTVEAVFENDRSADSPGPVSIVHYVPISLLLISVLIYGFYTHARLDFKTFFALMLFFIGSSIGLVIYLNMDNPQVRERAYFFLGSYYIIMYWIGFGIWGIIYDLYDWFREKGKMPAARVATMSMFLCFGSLVPFSVLSNHIDPKFNHFEVHDRSHDWMPWDYAYNILTSCEKDAILFTNGDNDTFPVWYLQEVMGFRRDIRVVNLSLLNTSWYILQLKNEMAPFIREGSGESDGINGKTLPIKYEDEFIEKTLCGRDEPALMRRLWPVEGKDVNMAGITWRLPTYHRLDAGGGEIVGMIRVQDEMVASIINWNNWERPIYFAVTVATENKIGLDDHLAMQGMVYRLEKVPAPKGQILVDVPTMADNVFDRYQYRSLDDDSIYKPPNTIKLVTNYFIGFAQLCERFANDGDRENAVKAAWGAINRTPNDFDKRLLLYQAMLSHDMIDEIVDFVEWESGTIDFRASQANRTEFYRILAAYGAEDLTLDLIKQEIAAPDFYTDPTGTARDRMKVYAILNILGEYALSDSLMKGDTFPVAKGDGVNARIDRVHDLIRKDKKEEALTAARALIKDYPDNILALKAHIGALAGTGRYEEVLQSLEHILELDPDDSAVQETRDIMMKRWKQIQQADSSKTK